MVVAVVAVRMVQMPVHQIVGVVSVRYCGVPAVRAVAMTGVVLTAVVVRRAVGWVPGTDRQPVFVHVSVVRVMEVAVVKIVDMAVVPDRRVSAARTVLMVVSLVDVVRHENLPDEGEQEGARKIHTDTPPGAWDSPTDQRIRPDDIAKPLAFFYSSDPISR